MTSPFKLGQLFHDRYLIQLDLGQGRLSHNYLANDAHRFDEPCLIKVFFPNLDHSITTENALKLFQQQAKTLYSLDHPQIANFREFFQLASPDRPQFYLVQDFVEGQTYEDLLSLRRSQGQGFSEAEIKPLFRQLLPVLSHLHDRGVFHRQLTPANIVRRDVDGLPMLVEFSDAPTDEWLGAAGFKTVQLAPGPGQDLFGLGVSGLTLLSGQGLTLRDQSPSFWQDRLAPLPLSQGFRRLLLNLLICSPEPGFESAAAVLATLEDLPPDSVIKPLDLPAEKPKLADCAIPEPQFVENETDPVITSEALPSPQSNVTARVTAVSPPQAPRPGARFARAKSVITRTRAFFSLLPSPKSMIKSKGATGFFKKALLLLGLMAIATGVPMAVEAPM